MAEHGYGTLTGADRVRVVCTMPYSVFVQFVHLVCVGGGGLGGEEEYLVVKLARKQEIEGGYRPPTRFVLHVCPLQEKPPRLAWGNLVL